MKVLALLGVAVLLAGCGGPKKAAPAPTTAAASSPATSPAATAATTTATTNATAASPSPLQAEAKAAATGDVPDNQVFLRYTNTSNGYSMKYPEGWAQQSSASTTTIRDKNNIVRVVVTPGGPVGLADASKDIAGVAGATITSSPRFTQVGVKRAVKVVYTTKSPQSAVTGKSLTLVVDRYYLWHGGKRAVVDLGTPLGVDNVDAYRLMIESFMWK